MIQTGVWESETSMMVSRRIHLRSGEAEFVGGKPVEGCLDRVCFALPGIRDFPAPNEGLDGSEGVVGGETADVRFTGVQGDGGEGVVVAVVDF